MDPVEIHLPPLNGDKENMRCPLSAKLKDSQFSLELFESLNASKYSAIASSNMFHRSSM
jgi:hypothetical protein